MIWMFDDLQDLKLYFVIIRKYQHAIMLNFDGQHFKHYGC